MEPDSFSLQPRFGYIGLNGRKPRWSHHNKGLSMSCQSDKATSVMVIRHWKIVGFVLHFFIHIGIGKMNIFTDWWWFSRNAGGFWKRHAKKQAKAVYKTCRLLTQLSFLHYICSKPMSYTSFIVLYGFLFTVKYRPTQVTTHLLRSLVFVPILTLFCLKL